MDRREFLRMLGMAGPVAAAAPTYFFAPIGGWHSDVIVNPNRKVVIVSNPSGPSSWVKQYFLDAQARGESIEHLLWGLPYYQTKPPAEYLGISRA